MVDEQKDPALDAEQASVEIEAEIEAEAQDTEQAALAQLQEQLAQSQAEVEQQKENALRLQAEMQNVRRRAENDVEKAHKFGVEKFARELLPVLDNLERALLACDADDPALTALREGVEMTCKMFVDGLAKFKVEEVDPQGEPFDPELHQAMSMVENNEVEPNTVTGVMQKGYTLHGRLLRPAMVVVSKAGQQASQVDEQA